MAAGGLTESQKMFHLPTSNINLTVTEGNIIETSAEALATGEDIQMDGHGGVSQLLIKTCPPTYKKAREQLKKTTKKFEYGKIYTCNFPHGSATRKPAVSFGMVLHAIVPSAKVVSKQKDWMDQMKVLYYNLFKAANNHGKASLALPLLGSGGAGASIDVAADVLVHALTTFRIKQDTKSPKQCLRDIILFVRKEAYSKVVTRLEGKGLPLPNGMVQHGSARPGTGSGKTRPASSLSSSKSKTPASDRGKSRPAQTWSTAQPGPKGATSPRGATSPLAGAPQDSGQDGMSNMLLILQGMTLESQSAFGSSVDRVEEDMDCDEFDTPVDGNATDGSEPSDDDTCAICLDAMDNPKKLDKCGHTFCKDCIEDSFKHHKPVCPSCNTVYGVITGNQPRGTMRMVRSGQSLPGYENCGQIIIDYEFPSGIQGPEHPNPGQPYRGTGRRAFLPDSAEGRKVYRLLCVAFQNRLIFTVGRSVTTGHDNVVTWNDIHHKTNPQGGATGFGYPDPHYLSRVQEELAAKGVTEECLQGRSFDL